MSGPHATLEFTDLADGQMSIFLTINGQRMQPKEIAASTLSPAQMIAAHVMADLHRRAEIAEANLNRKIH